VTVLTVTMLFGSEGRGGAGGFTLGALCSVRCRLGGWRRAVYMALRNLVASLLVF